MEHDYHIRIILEARDRVSKTINNIVINGDKNLVVLGKAFDKVGGHLDNLNKKVDNTGKQFNRNYGYIARFAEGLHQGGSKIRTFSSELDNGRNRLGRFGFTITRTIRDVDRFINLRWFLVLGFLNVMGNAVAVLGANLLALAASATKAAAALGGAFLAGIAQLIPVIALLQATMLRLDAVMKAVDLSEKARIGRAQDQVDAAKRQQDAADQLADAQYNLVKANEAVTESEYDLAQARKDLQDALVEQKRANDNLAEARRDAQRDIIDSVFEERDAALSLEEAELGVLQAKERLREEEQKSRLGNQDLEFARAQVREAQERLKIVTQEGDQAEISGATQQLAFAEQNLNAIINTAEEKTNSLKDAQLGVERAQLTREQAITRNRRAQQDARAKREEGVEGSDQVVAALKRIEDANEAVLDSRHQIIVQTRALSDANHNVAIALREVQRAHRDAAAAAKNQGTTQQNLAEALKDLSPAERQLVRAINRFKAVAKKEFGPIQDIIIGAFSRAVNAATELLQDPRIQRAATKLAKSIASVIDLFSDFSRTEEFRKALVFFTDQAARNVPKIGEALLDLLKIFLRIGRAATPLFNRLLDSFVKLISRIEVATRDPDRLDKFFAGAGKHLRSWIDLGKAVGNLFGAFVFDTTAAETGLGLLEDITDLLNDWADWIRENPEKVNKFFKNMREELDALSAVFGRFALLLFDVFTSDESAAFSKLILETFVPALGLFIKGLGAASKVLVTLFEIPVVGDLAKWAVQFAIIYGLANRLFALIGITGKGAFASLFRSLTNNNSALRRFARGLLTPISSMKELRDRAIQAVSKLQAFANTLETKVRTALTNGALLVEKFKIRVREAEQALLAKGKAALEAAARIGGKFRQAVIDAASSTAQFLKSIGTSAIATMRRFAVFLSTVVVNALRILRLNIRLLVGATGIGLIILAAGLIIEHWDKVKAATKKLLEAFGNVIDWIRKNWKEIVKIVIAVLLGPLGAIYIIYKFRDKILAAFGAIKDGIIRLFKEAFAWIRREFNKLGDWIEKKVRGIPLIGGLIAGKRELSNQDANEILADEALDPQRRKIKRLRKAGLGPKDIIAQLVSDEDVDEALIQKLAAKYAFATGGRVPGEYGKAVPVIAHAGEWILNRAQQKRISERLGATVEQTSNFLFGTQSNDPPRPGTGKAGFNNRGGSGKSKGDSLIEKYADFDLRAQTDDDGNVVWFIEQADGTFGQVSARDAAHIQRSNGTWIPGYVKRSTHGYVQNIMERISKFSNIGATGKRRGQHKYGLGGIVQAFANGGIVQPSYGMAGSMRHYDEGGIVLSSPSGGAATAPRIGEFTQNFEVKSEGDNDWNYVMRLAALHAQASF